MLLFFKKKFIILILLGLSFFSLVCGVLAQEGGASGGSDSSSGSSGDGDAGGTAGEEGMTLEERLAEIKAQFLLDGDAAAMQALLMLPIP